MDDDGWNNSFNPVEQGTPSKYGHQEDNDVGKNYRRLLSRRMWMLTSRNITSDNVELLQFTHKPLLSMPSGVFTVAIALSASPCRPLA